MTAAQHDLWTRAVAACLTREGEPARMLLLPALNEMFEAVDRERMARRLHPPGVIWLMLGLSALAAALFAGYSMANGTNRNWMYTVGIAAAISIVTYVFIDLEYPRLGLVRVDAIDQLLVEERARWILPHIRELRTLHETLLTFRLDSTVSAGDSQ
jgi:hypothetical protein